MRALALDPTEQTIAETEVHCDAFVIAKLFPSSYPHKAARFPNGDVLLAAPSDSTQAFTVGGSKPIVGPAVLVGRRLPLGEHAPARSSLDDVRSMVRWTTVEKIVKPVPPSNGAGDRD